MGIPKKFGELEFKHFAYLVRSNPITSTHCFDHQMVTFCNLLKKDSSIFGKVDHFYFVIEFYNRGSEHDHGLLCG